VDGSHPDQHPGTGLRSVWWCLRGKDLPGLQFWRRVWNELCLRGRPGSMLLLQRRGVQLGRNLPERRRLHPDHRTGLEVRPLQLRSELYWRVVLGSVPRWPHSVREGHPGPAACEVATPGSSGRERLDPSRVDGLTQCCCIFMQLLQSPHGQRRDESRGPRRALARIGPSHDAAAESHRRGDHGLERAHQPSGRGKAGPRASPRRQPLDRVPHARRAGGGRGHFPRSPRVWRRVSPSRREPARPPDVLAVRKGGLAFPEGSGTTEGRHRQAPRVPSRPHPLRHLGPVRAVPGRPGAGG